MRSRKISPQASHWLAGEGGSGQPGAIQHVMGVLSADRPFSVAVLVENMRYVLEWPGRLLCVDESADGPAASACDLCLLAIGQVWPASRGGPRSDWPS